jgi:hypothetical protein
MAVAPEDETEEEAAGGCLRPSRHRPLAYAVPQRSGLMPLGLTGIETAQVTPSVGHGALLIGSLAFSVAYSPLAVSNFHMVLEAERVCILIVSEFAATRPCRTSS